MKNIENKEGFNIDKVLLKQSEQLICPCCRSKKTYNIHLDGVRVCLDCDINWAI